MASIIKAISSTQLLCRGVLLASCTFEPPETVDLLVTPDGYMLEEKQFDTLADAEAYVDTLEFDQLYIVAPKCIEVDRLVEAIEWGNVKFGSGRTPFKEYLGAEEDLCN
jgi:hypothetical protein